jgi:hypothetical protein
MSPTSASLLSQLSSLDLASKIYLETLLSLPPEQALDNYLSQGTYAEDVWGPPAGAKRIIEATRTETNSDEEGRQKAVRRLGMILKHIALSGPSAGLAATPAAGGKGKGRAVEGDVVEVSDSNLHEDSTRRQREVGPPNYDHGVYGDILQHVPRGTRSNRQGTP